MTPKEIAGKLREAAELVQRVGLARGRRKDLDGSVCALGALDIVMAGESRADYQTVGLAVVNRLGLWVGNHQDPFNRPPQGLGIERPDFYVARWSNLSAGKEEVAGGFLKVAKMLEAEDKEQWELPTAAEITADLRQHMAEPPVVPIRMPVFEIRAEEEELVGV